MFDGNLWRASGSKNRPGGGIIDENKRRTHRTGFARGARVRLRSVLTFGAEWASKP